MFTGAQHRAQTGEGGQSECENWIFHAHSLSPLGHGQNTPMERFLPSG